MCADEERCWMNFSVANVMTKAAVVEHIAMSGSTAMIFLTRVTEDD